MLDIAEHRQKLILKNLAQLKYLSVKQLLLNLTELKHTMLI